MGKFDKSIHDAHQEAIKHFYHTVWSSLQNSSQKVIWPAHDGI